MKQAITNGDWKHIGAIVVLIVSIMAVVLVFETKEDHHIDLLRIEHKLDQLLSFHLKPKE